MFLGILRERDSSHPEFIFKIQKMEGPDWALSLSLSQIQEAHILPSRAGVIGTHGSSQIETLNNPQVGLVTDMAYLASRKVDSTDLHFLTGTIYGQPD